MDRNWHSAIGKAILFILRSFHNDSVHLRTYIYLLNSLSKILNFVRTVMSTLKRSASPGVLVGKPSPFHTSVTLFTSDAVSASNHGDTTSIGVLTTRRSKRIKLEQVENPIPEQRDEKPELPDSEEPLPRKRKTRAASKNAVASSSNVKLEEVELKTVVTPQKSKKQASPKKPKPIQQSLDVPHPAPPQWKETYDTIKEMRAKIVAPVDTMGCDQAQFKEQDPRVRLLSLHPSNIYQIQTESKILYSRIFDAFFTDQGRGD